MDEAEADAAPDDAEVNLPADDGRGAPLLASWRLN